MKCYRCGEEVSDDSKHCEHCGALLKITNKLLTAIQVGHKEAIIQLYKMLYNNVYNRFLQLGIDEQEIPGLINKAYNDFVLHSHEVTAVETFEPYFYGVCDNVAFTYLKSNGLEPQELDQESFVEPDPSIIDKMLEEIDKKDDEKPIKEKKPSHKWIIFVIVIALIVAGTGGYYGYKVINKKAIEKKRTQAYLNISDQYVAAVKAIATDNSSKSYKKVTKKYPLVAKQAYVTYYRNSSSQILKSLIYKFYDLDGDGSNELLIGYKDDSGMEILGIYRNNGKKVTSVSPIDDIKHEWKYILTTQHYIVKGYKNDEGKYVYSILGLKNNKFVTITSSINNLSQYLKKKGLKRVSVSGQAIENKQTDRQQLLTAQERWVQCIKLKQYKKADQIGRKLGNNVEDPCAYSMSKAMKKAYLAKIKEYQEKYNGINYYSDDSQQYQPYTMGYLLSDLDGDGQAELMIEWGRSNNTNDYLAVFSYKNGHIKTINKKLLINSCFLLYYPNHAGMIWEYGHTGLQLIQIIYMKNDQIKYDDIAEINIDEENLSSLYYITSGMTLNRHVKSESYDSNPILNFDILE